MTATLALAGQDVTVNVIPALCRRDAGALPAAIQQQLKCRAFSCNPVNTGVNQAMYPCGVQSNARGTAVITDTVAEVVTVTVTNATRHRAPPSNL